MKRLLLAVLFLASAFIGFSAFQKYTPQTLTLSGSVLFPTGGGTGTSTVPGFDRILIGDGTNRYAVKKLTAGTNITIATSSGAVTISSTASGGGSGTVSTSTNETPGALAYWTSSSATPALLGKVATTSLTANSPLSLSNAISVIGASASALSLDTSGTWTGNAGTATALAANGANCSSGNAPLGVDASGAVESCFDVWTEAENTSAAYTPQSRTLTVAGTANQITSSAGAQDLSSNRTWTLSIPSLFQIQAASTTILSANWAKFGGTASSTFDTAGNATIGNDLTVTGVTTLATSLTGFLKAASGVISTALIGVADLASADFGSFTCNGSACTVDSGAIANSQLANSSVSYGGVSVSLGGSDATPAFDLTDATSLPIVNGTTGTLTYSRGGTGTSTAALLGQVLSWNGTNYQAVSTSSLNISASPAGSDTQVQFNDGGSTGADADFTWDKTTNTLAIPNISTTSAITLNSTNITSGAVTLLSQALGVPRINISTNKIGLSFDDGGGFIRLGDGASDRTGIYLSSDNTSGTFKSLILNTDNLATTDKTWTIGNFSGSPALGNYFTGFLNGHIPFGASGLLATSSAFTFDSTNSRLSTTYASTTAISGTNSTWSGIVEAVTGILTSILRIPYSASPTVSTNGDIGIDSTSNQFKYQSGGATRVVVPFSTMVGGHSTTTWTGTTTINLAPAAAALTFTGARCYSTTGTVGVSLYDGTNRANYIPTASSTTNLFTYTTNNTFTAGEPILVDMGNPASSPVKVSCRFIFTYDAD